MRFSIFVIILLIIASCSHKSDADLYNGGKAAEEQKDFQKAAELYEEAVAKYHTSVYAESSLIHLAFMYNNDVRDARKAINAYKRYYELFPSSKEAPTMLFLSGFIYNNELHQLDSARLVYDSFLQKYPNHELAASAKFELETLGRDPGQAIAPQVAEVDRLKSEQAKKATKK